MQIILPFRMSGPCVLAETGEAIAARIIIPSVVIIFLFLILEFRFLAFLCDLALYVLLFFAAVRLFQGKLLPVLSLIILILLLAFFPFGLSLILLLVLFSLFLLCCVPSC